MPQQVNWDLLAKYLSGECGKSEKQKIENWINSAPENGIMINSMQGIWNKSEQDLVKSDINRLWTEVAERSGISANTKEIRKADHKVFDKRRSPLSWFKLYPVLQYAAVIILIAALPLFYTNILKPLLSDHSPALKKFTVDYEKQAQINLSDGTVVKLDAGSVFLYPETFSGSSREVFLNGEEYFEVAVAEGKVLLQSNEISDENGVILTKGQLSTLKTNEKPTEPRTIDVEKVLSWQNHEIIFEDTPVQEILDQLERWYDINFTLTNREIGEEHLTIHINNKPIEDILELIAAITNLKYEVKGNTILLK